MVHDMQTITANNSLKSKMKEKQKDIDNYGLGDVIRDFKKLTPLRSDAGDGGMEMEVIEPKVKTKKVSKKAAKRARKK